ncbi:(Fe-S)-binding protein [Vibrio chagasii]|nr:(Fe-S)-binding protein [Vibrio chagasii]
MPAADDLVDRCIECGFCEPVCPSRTLTLSPRQRIVLYRELQRRRAAGEEIEASELEKPFEYQGIDTSRQRQQVCRCRALSGRH